MRLHLLMILIAAGLAMVTPARGDTPLVWVSPAPPLANAAWVGDGYYAQQSWTLSEPYTNVSISVWIRGLSGGPVNLSVPGTAYLTSNVAPEQQQPFLFPETYGPTALVTVFSGLTLPAGTYYLTLATTSSLGGAWLVQGSSSGITVSRANTVTLGPPMLAGPGLIDPSDPPLSHFAPEAWGPFLFDVVAGPLQVTTPSLTTGVAGQSYYGTLTAANGTPPYFWAVASGRLPAGLTLESTTGQIRGIPASPSSSTVTFQVMDSSPPAQTATATLILTVVPNFLTIATTSLPNGQVGSPYSQRLQYVAGNPPVTWSLNPGYALPPGLTFNASGLISGTPTTAVTNYRFLVQATDASTPPQTATAVLVITITSSGS